jgi:hypothetical protein
VKRAVVLSLAAVIAAAALAASACGGSSDAALQGTVTPSPGSSSATMPVSRSPSPSPSPSRARRHHRALHHHSAPAAPPPAPASSQTSQTSGAWCTATASVYNAEYNWNNVYVNSNQPYTDATASADGYSWSYETNGSGYAEIYLNGPPPGAEITVTVGAATCTTSD